MHLYTILAFFLTSLLILYGFLHNICKQFRGWAMAITSHTYTPHTHTQRPFCLLVFLHNGTPPLV